MLEDIKVKGSRDRQGKFIPGGWWAIQVLGVPYGERGSKRSFVAHHAATGLWLSGITWDEGLSREGVAYGDECLVWETEQFARENHEERLRGEVL